MYANINPYRGLTTSLSVPELSSSESDRFSNLPRLEKREEKKEEREEKKEEKQKQKREEYSLKKRDTERQ